MLRGVEHDIQMMVRDLPAFKPARCAQRGSGARVHGTWRAHGVRAYLRVQLCGCGWGGARIAVRPGLLRAGCLACRLFCFSTFAP